ncbi:MAG: Dihydrolipoyllysine-residue acetyltransferase component of pyruvate dehydrogenase complex [Bacteroidota bacterium]|jgi:pyruvate dehydrogenase E2 component (dihydrolipoamide acetyltransferase)
MAYEFKLPSLGDGVSGKVTDILVKPGDKVSKDQVVLVVGTDKVDAEMPVDVDGVVEEVLVKKGDEVTEGTPVLRLQTSDAAPAAPAPAPAVAPVPATAPAPAAPAAAAAAPAPAPEKAASTPGSLRVSPLARKRAKEFGVNLSDVRPADGSGRISYKDVVDFVKRKVDSGGGSVSGAMARKPLPDFSKFGETERKAQGNVAIKTVEAMSYAKQTIPHAWISEKIDITKIEALRQQYKDQVKAAGGSLTMTAIIAKAVSVVLRKLPIFNTSLDADTNEVIYKKYINIGIAVDTPNGLFVPNIKNVDKKGLTEVAVDLADITGRTKAGKIAMADIQGGTFTISNIGGIGGTNMLSIVNWPETAILSVVAAQMEPVWQESTKSFEPRLMMPVTIGWDHRVINGGDAARFVVELKNIIEEPFLGWL